MSDFAVSVDVLLSVSISLFLNFKFCFLRNMNFYVVPNLHCVVFHVLHFCEILFERCKRQNGLVHVLFVEQIQISIFIPICFSHDERLASKVTVSILRFTRLINTDSGCSFDFGFGPSGVRDAFYSSNSLKIGL